jgi:hypothetical protein
MLDAIKGCSELMVIKEELLEQDMYVLTTIAESPSGPSLGHVVGVFASQKEARYAEVFAYESQGYYCVDEDEDKNTRFYEEDDGSEREVAKVHKCKVILPKHLDNKLVGVHIVGSEENARIIVASTCFPVVEAALEKDDDSTAKILKYYDGTFDTYSLELSEAKNEAELKERATDYVRGFSHIEQFCYSDDDHDDDDDDDDDDNGNGGFSNDDGDHGDDNNDVNDNNNDDLNRMMMMMMMMRMMTEQ